MALSPAKQVFRFFASLKLAVVSLLSLSAVLAVATVLESIYGTRAAQVMVYSTWWFAGVLLLLGINVFCAAAIRYPWKPRQTGFVVTHLGIIILLIGSWVTQQSGIDGNLPVTEGQQGNGVFLTGATLTVQEEDSEQSVTYPIEESGRAKKGQILSVELPGGKKVEVQEFYPRAVYREVFVESPLEKSGAPAIEIELKSSRFQMSQWLSLQNPDSPTEWSLGPAKVEFKQLWTKSEEKHFFDPPKKDTPKKTDGYLVAFFQGRELRIPLKTGTVAKRQIGATQFNIIIDRYLPHAIVDGMRLINKSNEPVNPAAQLTVKSTLGTEKHTVFARFPQFPTIHRNQTTGPASGIRFRLFTPEEESQENEMAIIGRGRGRLKLAQSVDGERLLYQVVDSKNKVTTQGELNVGSPIRTGWMDIEFKVHNWIPSAVKVLKPHYVDKISGGAMNFLTAIYVDLKDPERSTASQAETGQWLMEGAMTSYTVDNRRYMVRYGRKRLDLPFGIFLKKFTIGTNPGTNKAASYASDVLVKAANRATLAEAKISMNEPLKHEGFTFYQASYQERPGQPYVSIFSVNRDPGRWVKYLGSILLCLGICIMFYMNPHYFDKIALGFLRRKS